MRNRMPSVCRISSSVRNTSNNPPNVTVYSPYGRVLSSAAVTRQVMRRSNHASTGLVYVCPPKQWRVVRSSSRPSDTRLMGPSQWKQQRASNWSGLAGTDAASRPPHRFASALLPTVVTAASPLATSASVAARQVEPLRTRRTNAFRALTTAAREIDPFLALFGVITAFALFAQGYEATRLKHIYGAGGSGGLVVVTVGAARISPPAVHVPAWNERTSAVGPASLGGWNVAASLTAPAVAGLSITSKDSFWDQAGKRWGVDPLLIYSIALVESRALQSNGNIAPTPWVARINQHLVMGGEGRVKRALAQADTQAVPVQDVGIMQVYYPMHRDLESDPVALLDPRHNIMIGTEILLQAMRQSSDPVLAVGYYHSHNPVLARYYGRAVLTVYHRLQGIYPRLDDLASKQ